MYTFLLLLFPISLFRHIIREDNRYVPRMAWWGAAAGVAVCTAKAFLTFSYRVASASFVIEAAHDFLSLTGMPVAVSAVILLIGWKAGVPLTDCICAFFAAIASFMAVYLPFATLSGARSAYSPYELFFRPPLYLMMMTSISRIIKLIAAAHMDTSLHLRRMGYPLLAVFLIAPCITDTLWFVSNSAWTVVWGVYMAFAFLWYVICAPRT